MSNLKLSNIKKAIYKNRNIIFIFLLFSVLVTAFISLAEDVIDKETLAWDRGVLLAINKGSNMVLDTIMPILTHAGGAIGVTLITAILLFIYFRKKDYSRFSLILFSVAGSTILNIVLKLFIKRQRPNLWNLLVYEPTFSFPSGHAMASSALAFSLIFALRHSKNKNILRLILILYMLIVAYSRMYLGVHYPTDIIGGWIVSLAWTLIVLYFLKNRLNEDYIL